MRKIRLLSSTIIAGLAFTLISGASAQAQDAAGAAQTPTTADNPQVGADGATEVGEIVVTGTRLRLQDFTLSNPVASVSSEKIEFSGTTDITSFLQELPALQGSIDLQDNADAGNRGNAGLNLLDLRNLGTDRTLVLVNGRRHVGGSSGSTAVDINSIPIALIDRVEVLTGGASALYGADGVSGVVNFILRRDFEGFDFRVQKGVSDEGGGDDVFASALFGTNFAEDRGNFNIGFEYDKNDALKRDDRSFTQLTNRLTLVRNPAENASPGDDPNIPDRIFARDVRYIDSALEGGVYTDLDFGDSLAGVDFLGTGVPWRDGIRTAGFTAIGGFGTPLTVFQTELIPELERQAVNGGLTYEFAPQARFFSEAKFVQTKTSFLSQPTFDYSLFVPIDNPFIPAAIRADAIRPFVDDDDPGGLANSDDPLGVGPGVLVARDNLDLGEVRRDIERQTTRVVLGLEGDLTEDFSYEVSYVYGRTKERNTEQNNRINERFYAAIDAVRAPNGQIVCRSNLTPGAVPLGNYPGFGSSEFDGSSFGTTFTPGANSGCVPANIFGQNISQAARDFIVTDTTDTSEITQHVLNGFISGDTSAFFELPAGPVDFSIGAEYRKEESDFDPDDLLELAAELGTDITWLGQSRRTTGEFDVSEIFGEVSVPLLRDVPFIQALTVDGAYRYSDYSTVGTTDTYKYGGQWRISDDFMLRATKARAVRAPNINELFLPQVQTFAILTDPCDRDEVGLGRNPATRLRNCTAALQPLGLSPTTFDNTSSSSIEGTTGGNPNLEAEEADTTTYGFVLTPRFLPGLSLSLDYYDIELSNAINTFAAQTIVDNCFDLEQPNAFCNGLVRETNRNLNSIGRFLSFQQFSVNVASYTTSGYDLTVRYEIDPSDYGIERDIGRFQLSLLANKLEDLTFIEVVGETPDEDVGEVGSPEYQVNFDLTWLYGPLTVNYGFTYTDTTIRFPDTYDADPDYLEDRYKFYEERFTQDIQVRYDIDDRFTVYGGVNNFTDQEPDVGAVQTPVSAIGRFFYVGATARFGGN